MEIDRERLGTLAADPRQTTAEISAALGLGGPHNLYYELNKDAELKKIFEAGRASVKATKSGEKPARELSQRSSRHCTPPRNGNAKGGVSKELLRKLILEFNHLDVYGVTSEHFEDIRKEMGALL